MAFDPIHNRTILFGGQDYFTTFNYFNDLWVYTTAAGWELVHDGTVSGIPSARERSRIAYCPDQDKFVMFGGEDSTSFYIAETWELELSYSTGGWSFTWTQTANSGAAGTDFPAARIGHGLVYRPEAPPAPAAKQNGRGRARAAAPPAGVYLFGGALTASAATNDYWRYDPATQLWTKLLADNPTPGADQPSRRAFFGMAEVFGGILLYGGAHAGTAISETWDEVDGTWQNLSSTGNPGACDHVYLFHSTSRGWPLLYGIDAGTGKVWEFIKPLARWSLIDDSTTSPKPSVDTGFAQLPAASESVMWVGPASAGLAREWTYQCPGNTAPEITHSPPTGYTENTALTIVASVDDPDGVSANTWARLYYRNLAEPTFQQVDMAQPSPAPPQTAVTYTASIPAAANRWPGVEYYIEAGDFVNTTRYPTGSTTEKLDYPPDPGSLTIHIGPDGTDADAAVWKISHPSIADPWLGNALSDDQTQHWLRSGETYNIEFDFTALYNPPSPNPGTITVAPGANNLVAAFQRKSGTLNISILGGVGGYTVTKTNAPFDFNGGAPLHLGTDYSDTTVPTGDYSITFDDVANYQVTVTANPFSVSGGTAVGTLGEGMIETITGAYTQLTFTVSGHTMDTNGQALGGVTVGMTGDQSGSKTTAGDGAYSFTVDNGDTVMITPLLDGYSFAPDSYTFSNVAADQTCNFIGARITYPISGTVETGIHTGNITPTNENVQHGNNSSVFTWAPEVGYMLDKVVIDGNDAGAPYPTSHRFTNVTTAHTIQVWFIPIKYTIQATAGPNGAIMPAGIVEIEHGGDKTFSILPDSDYHVADVLVDSAGVGAVDSYDFKSVNTDHTIHAEFARDTGALSVTVAGGGGTGEEGRWRRVGTTHWHPSGHTETGIPTGSATVEFLDVYGWTTPSPRSVVISKDNTVDISAAYVRDVGALRVLIEPRPVNLKGAKWRLKDTDPINAPAPGAWRDSGFTEIGLPVGRYTVEFFEVVDWTKPPEILVDVVKSDVTVKTAYYEQHKGALQVFIQPPEAGEAGGKWTIDGFDWYNSGHRLDDLAVGAHTVRYTLVEGWSRPAPEDIFIKKDETAIITGAYSRSAGSLQVLIEPAEARKQGAQWRINRATGEVGVWRDSGFTETGLEAGAEVRVEFKGLPGWATPLSRVVGIRVDETVTITGRYTKDLGSLRVHILPLEAERAGGRWRLEGTDRWLQSGAVLENLPVGDLTVEFGDVPGWSAPANKTAAIKKNQVTDVVGAYAPLAASVHGRVVDQDGRPVHDVSVKLTGAANNKAYYAFVGKEDEGSFEFRNVAVGDKYYYVASKLGWEFINRGENSVVVDEAELYVVPDIIGRLARIWSIAGRVMTPDGKGIANHLLVLRKDTPASAPPDAEGAGLPTRTDSSGNYRFSDLPLGDYVVEDPAAVAGAADYEIRPPSQKVGIKTGDVSKVDFVLTPAGLSISGYALQADGRTPIAGVAILGKQTSGPWAGRSLTDAKGFYEFTNLAGNLEYRLEVQDRGREYLASSIKLLLSDKDVEGVNFVEKAGPANSLKIGPVTVLADSITKSGDAWIAQGNVHIGAHMIMKSEQNLVLSPETRTIAGDGGLVLQNVPKLGAATLHRGAFSIVDGLFQGAPSGENLAFGGYLAHPTGFSVNDKLVELQVKLALDFSLVDVLADALVLVDPGGVALQSFSYENPSLAFGLWSLDGLEVSYNQKNNSFDAAATLVTPLFSLFARLTIVDGQLTAIDFGTGRELILFDPHLFLDGLRGYVTQLVGAQPVELAGAGAISLGRDLLSQGRMNMKLSGDFSFVGDTELLSLPVGQTVIDFILGIRKLGMGFDLRARGGDETFIEVDGLLQAGFEPFYVWGGATATLEFVLDLLGGKGDFAVDERYELKNLGAELVGGADGALKINIWGELLGARLEAEIDGDGFRILKPDFARDVGISWSPAAEPPDHRAAAAGATPADSSTAFEVPEGVGAAYFMIAWEYGDLNTQLESPSGEVITGIGGLHFGDAIITIKTGKRYSYYNVQHPESGQWKVSTGPKKGGAGSPLSPPGEDANGRIYFDMTLYAENPSVAITSAEQVAENQVLVTLDRTQLRDEKLDLYYGPTDDEEEKYLIAGSDQIGDESEWIWDTSAVRPGSYYLYSRIYNAQSHPFTYRYAQAVGVAGDLRTPFSSKPEVELSGLDATVSWRPAADADLTLYRVYYTDDLKAKRYDACVEVGRGSSAVVLNEKKLKPGRKYKLVVSAVFADGSESAYSPPAKFTYRAPGVNNIPYFSSKPPTTVNINKNYSYKVKAKDLDRDKLTFAFKKAPDGMTIDPDSGQVAWQPAAEDVGRRRVDIVVSDTQGAEEVQTFKLYVRDPSTEGTLEVHAVRGGDGRKGYVVSYWNPHLNQDIDRPEALVALLSAGVGSVGVPIALHESGLSSGYFAAYLDSAAVERVRDRARIDRSERGLWTDESSLDALVIGMAERGHENEKTGLRAHRGSR